MAFQPPVDCPLCEEVLELDRTLEDHLVGKHSPLEVAHCLASLSQQVELQPSSE